MASTTKTAAKDAPEGRPSRPGLAADKRAGAGRAPADKREAIMTAALVLLVTLLRDAGAPDAVVLVVGSIAGAVVFVPLLVVLEPELVRFVASFVRDRRRRPAGDGVADAPIAGASGP